MPINVNSKQRAQAQVCLKEWRLAKSTSPWIITNLENDNYVGKIH
jgi:hypothetical protein